MFGSIIFTCYKARRENFDCPMAATAFVVPFAFFFPLQQFGSFYGQWGNLFMWFAIGFTLAQYQVGEELFDALKSIFLKWSNFLLEQTEENLNFSKIYFGT